MHSGKYVFTQLSSFFNRYEFNKCVDRYNGDHRVKSLNCWNQFLQLFFGQLTSRDGLRDICLCLKAHESKLYHLGIKQSVNQSTLSRANENRNWHIFEDYGHYLIGLVSVLYKKEPLHELNLDNEVFIMDSTSISVSITLLSWALGKYSRGCVKVHTLMNARGNIPVFICITDGKTHDINPLDQLEIIDKAIYVMDKAYIDFKRLYSITQKGAFFVVRAKSKLAFRVIDSHAVNKDTGLRCDQVIKLTGPKSKKLYPDKLRRVKLRDSEKDNTLVFLTNNFDIQAIDIAQLYKNRWQIEVFFKWIKQNLQIKTMWGYSENAVRINIWMAISTYLIIAYVKKQIKTELSIHEMIQILGISVFDKTPINELLTKNKIKQNVKEQINLFNMNDLETHQ